MSEPQVIMMGLGYLAYQHLIAQKGTRYMELHSRCHFSGSQRVY